MAGAETIAAEFGNWETWFRTGSNRSIETGSRNVPLRLGSQNLRLFRLEEVREDEALGRHLQAAARVRKRRSALH